MRVSYKGMDKNYPYRVAEIYYDEEREQELVDETIDLMKEWWDIEYVTNEYCICPVEDRDDYNAFMKDWKECKKEAREKLKAAAADKGTEYMVDDDVLDLTGGFSNIRR